MISIKFFDKNSVKKVTSTKKFQEAVSNVTNEAGEKIKQSASNIGDKISGTVSDVKNKISEVEAERERKNFEKMNQIRYNSAHLSDAQLRTFINDSSLDKFKRIGYAAAFADRYSDRS